MIEPQIPENEPERLAALQEYQILDTLPEKDFDDITKIAAEICGTPISLVSLIDPDRQWFKSHHGLGATETPRRVAFCAHAINKPDEVLVVPDASKDERFHDNPLSTDAPDVIFYAGAPLISPDGFALGTLCVIDHEPRDISPGQVDTLKSLANQVMGQLELRKKIRLLESSKTQLEDANKHLSSFAHMVAHDLKAPLRGISSVVSWMKEEFSDELGEEGLKYIDLLDERSVKMNTLIEGLLAYAKSIRLGDQEKESFLLGNLVKEVKRILDVPDGTVIRIPEEPMTVFLYRRGLQQVLQNLFSNAIKYNDKEQVEITIEWEETPELYRFWVKDNGPGISAADRERIFQVFQTLGVRDRYDRMGTGIGLATVQNIVERMGGEIQLDSQMSDSSGSSFVFTLAK